MSNQRRIDTRDLYPDLDGFKGRPDPGKPILAILVVASFCGACIVTLVGTLVTGSFDEGIQVLRTIAAVFGWPLGFVLGHYFARKLD